MASGEGESRLVGTDALLRLLIDRCITRVGGSTTSHRGPTSFKLVRGDHKSHIGGRSCSRRYHPAQDRRHRSSRRADLDGPSVKFGMRRGVFDGRVAARGQASRGGRRRGLSSRVRVASSLQMRSMVLMSIQPQRPRLQCLLGFSSDQRSMSSCCL